MSIRNLVSSRSCDINCDQLIYDSKTISNISADTVEINNLTFSSLIDRFTYVNVNSTIASGAFVSSPPVNIDLYRFGNKVFFQIDEAIETTVVSPTADYRVVAQLPVGYRPPQTFYIPCLYLDDTVENVGHIEVAGSGVVTFGLNNNDALPSSALFGNRKVSFCYIV